MDLLRAAGQRSKIEEEQGNTAVFETRHDSLPRHFFVAFSGRHDSGYSVELEPDATRAECAAEFPAKILAQVNFARGFVRPHTIFNLAVGQAVALNEHVGLRGQCNVENLFNQFYLYTFESVFSGTTIGRPRTFSGRVSLNFK